MKKLSFVLVFLISFSFGQKRVGICLDDTLATRWNIELNVFKKAFHNDEFQEFYTICVGDAASQVEQAMDLIDNKKVDYLLIVANDGKLMAPVVDYAAKKKVVTIAYDRMIPSKKLDFYVSFDNVKVGELMAEAMLKKVPKGNYMIISGPKKDNNSLLLRKGQLNVLQPEIDKGNVNLVFDKHAIEWISTAASDEFLGFIQEEPDTKVDVVLSANDNMAAGVIETTSLFEIADVFVAGQDAEKEALLRVKDGSQSITVKKSVAELASMTIDLIKAIDKHGKFSHENAQQSQVKKTTVYLLDPTVIDQTNVDSELK